MNCVVTAANKGLSKLCACAATLTSQGNIACLNKNIQMQQMTQDYVTSLTVRKRVASHVDHGSYGIFPVFCKVGLSVFNPPLVSAPLFKKYNKNMMSCTEESYKLNVGFIVTSTKLVFYTEICSVSS